MLDVIAGRRASWVDVALLVLTRSANHSVLWFVLAAGLGRVRGRRRRAALRGLLAIGGASFTVNALAKPLTPRRRPAHAHLPIGRALPAGRRPVSSSFPSGHAASAAAFTTAVAMEHPAAGAAIAPVAALVAYSRVHTGVHWPSDVVSGAGIGAAVAFATTRWWPVRGDETAAAARPADLPDLGAGEGLLVLVNPGAGADDIDPGAELARCWPAARLLYPDPEVELDEQICAALAQAPAKALGVAGGDGTVAAVASVAARERLPLVVVPAGTLNHFARDNGITDLQELCHAVEARAGAFVDLGAVQVDGSPVRWFINTSSVGGYPDLVRLREGWEPRWGKWPAAAAALVVVLRAAEPLHVRIDGVSRKVWLLFVGNGRYRPRGLAVARASLDTATLDVRYVRADLRWSRTRFVIAALTGALERSRTYVQREQATLELEVVGSTIALATDGEVTAEGRRFRFRAQPDMLAVYRPQ